MKDVPTNRFKFAIGDVVTVYLPKQSDLVATVLDEWLTSGIGLVIGVDSSKKYHVDFGPEKGSLDGIFEAYIT